VGGGQTSGSLGGGGPQTSGSLVGSSNAEKLYDVDPPIKRADLRNRFKYIIIKYHLQMTYNSDFSNTSANSGNK
jgi:hypothetical protein